MCHCFCIVCVTDSSLHTHAHKQTNTNTHTGHGETSTDEMKKAVKTTQNAECCVKRNDWQQEVQRALISRLKHADASEKEHASRGETVKTQKHQICKKPSRRPTPHSHFHNQGESADFLGILPCRSLDELVHPPLLGSVFTSMPALWLPVKRWHPWRGFWAYQEEMPLKGQMFWGLSGLPPKLLPSFHCIFALAL